MGASSKPVIGLIGAIGAGKTTVAAALADRGGFRIDADALGHEALEDALIRDRLVRRFGNTIVRDDGGIDRRKLGTIVFSTPAHRLELEAIVFPYIKERAEHEIARGQLSSSHGFIVVDAAVMLEAGWHGVCDRLIYVDAPRELRVRRVAERGWTEADLTARELAQWPAERKIACADAIIINAAGVAELNEHVDRVLAEFGITATSLNESAHHRAG